jgi:hypothetical protein
MADKEITVAVPEERVPEFYSWFAAFLTAEPAARAGRGTMVRPKPGQQKMLTRPPGCTASWRHRPASCSTC